MLLSEQPDKIPLAFAENGEKDVIPEGSSPFDGRASLNDGFPPETRQALIDGGIPPSGLDMNGILWLATAINRWQSAGGFFVYDNDFATDTNVDGYPKSAMLVRADGTGFWVSTADNNTTDPDAGGAGWQPVNNIGIHSVSMTVSDVTLTAAQSAKDLIVISGTLSANVNLIFPTTVKSWIVTNNTTGAYTITCKTASGTGGVITQGASRIFYGDGTNLYGVSPLASSQAQVDAGTDTATFLTPKTFKDSSLRAVKASQAEVDAGSDDTKFVTPKTFKDSSLRAVKASQAEVDAGSDDTKFVTANTLANDTKWGTKADLVGNSTVQFFVDYATDPEHATPLYQVQEGAISAGGIIRSVYAESTGIAVSSGGYTDIISSSISVTAGQSILLRITAKIPFTCNDGGSPEAVFILTNVTNGTDIDASYHWDRDMINMGMSGISVLRREIAVTPSGSTMQFKVKGIVIGSTAGTAGPVISGVASYSSLLIEVIKV